MLKERWHSLFAIGIIIIAGMLYTNGFVSRNVALLIAVIAYMLTQGVRCYQMHKKHEKWHREAIMGITFLLIMVVLLVL